MSLIQSAISRYQEAIYQVAVSVSQFERETLHIPLACCFFTPTAGPDEQFDQGFMFVITPVWAFVIMPLLDWTFGNWPSLFGDRAPWRYVGTYLLLISTFWAVIVMCRMMD
ncbi:hypothetical protein DE146DRAFT_68443 [Phaeosphaeria sp. MPI-PUGE-AT-0046c]|nr:hypothetical protein DE146DRAFT_68443 [Phaeosphaeria sp. MPI-PUGE-AT-0046c]